MKQLPLAVQARPAEKKGTSNSRRMRRQGLVPAEIYGPDQSNLSVTLQEKEFTRLIASLKGESVLFSLQVENGPAEPILAMVKEIQYGRMDHSIQHCDFLKVKMDQKIRVRVPLRVINVDQCVGVKANGNLQHFLRAIELYCLPTQVPVALEVDAAPLEIGASLHVSDLKVPEGVKIVTPSMTVVVMVAEQAAEEKVAEVVAATAEGAAPVAGGTDAAGAAAGEPEVITAKKKDGEAAAPAPAAGKKADKK